MNRMTHLLVTALAAVTVGATVPAVASAAAPPSEAQVLAAARGITALETVTWA